MTAKTTFQKGRIHGLFPLWNGLGAVFDRMHVRLPMFCLDEENLFKTAMRSTGFSDFGPDYFREPLHILLEAVKQEGRLTWNGRRLARLGALQGLEARLLTQQAFKEHPDILEQPVRRPLIVVGAPRTGTTLMNHLLALDPAARPLLMWESVFPTPWHGKRHVKYDPRITLCAFLVWTGKRVMPELAIMHDFGHNVPDECHWLFWPSFVWPPAMIMPSVRKWLKNQPDSTYDNVYGEYRRALQMLHWQRPANGHWVLKSPLHAWALPSLMKVVPEASVIHTHRNLREVIPSFCSLGAAIASMYTDAIDPKQMGAPAMEIARDVIDRIKAGRKKIDLNRLCDITFSGLVADPVGSVRMIYDKFGYEFTPEFEKRILKFASEHTPSSRPKHVYSLEQFNLDGNEIDKAFSEYHREYGLDN